MHIMMRIVVVFARLSKQHRMLPRGKLRTTTRPQVRTKFLSHTRDALAKEVAGRVARVPLVMAADEAAGISEVVHDTGSLD